VSDLTPEELDKARTEEALQLNVTHDFPRIDVWVKTVAETAARLAREGWTPTPKVDPDLEAFSVWKRQREKAGWDPDDPEAAFLAGIKRGRANP
jgi:hypothetical protein